MPNAAPDRFALSQSRTDATGSRRAGQASRSPSSMNLRPCSPRQPEHPFAFFETDSIRRYRQDRKDEAADRSRTDEASLLRAHPSVFHLQPTPPASLARLRRLTAFIASAVPSCSVPNHRSQARPFFVLLTLFASWPQERWCGAQSTRRGGRIRCERCRRAVGDGFWFEAGRRGRGSDAPEPSRVPPSEDSGG